jgi:outer membrane protein assembly factor BamB
MTHWTVERATQPKEVSAMDGESKDEVCERHPAHAVTGTCAGCGKPVCRECAKQFGYYCSQKCLDTARSNVSEQSRRRQRETEAALRSTARLGKLVVLVLGGLVTVLVFCFAWSVFLDPAGKVCWQWRPPAGTTVTRILGCDASGVTVLAGNTVVVLDPVKGKELRAFTLPVAAAPGDPAASEGGDEDADFAGGAAIRTLPDGALLQQSQNGLRCLDRDGTGKFTKTLAEGSLRHLVLSPDQSRAYCVTTVPTDVAAATRAKASLRQAHAEIRKAYGGADSLVEDLRAEPPALTALRARAAAAYEVLAQTRTGILCCDLQSGNELWASPKMKKGTSVEGLAAGANALYAVIGMGDARSDVDASEPASVFLFALSPADGQRLWQASLKASPSWGPTPVGDLVLVQSEEEVQAFGPDGSVAYAIPLGEDSYSQPEVLAGLLWILGENGARCHDAATGQEKWGLRLAVRENGILACGKRVYVSGEVEETLADKDVKLPAAYQDVAKLPEVKGILEQARKKTVHVVVAVDRDTGEELWRVRNAYGALLGDEKRFVLVADTAQTSLLEMATGGKGTTVVRQFSTRKGKQLYIRQSDLGFMQPRLVGKRIVGIVYERTERPSLFTPGSLEASGPSLRPHGVAAYRVK